MSSKRKEKQQRFIQNLVGYVYPTVCWRLDDFVTVIVAPPFVLSTGTAGGFRRLGGAGGADLRWVDPEVGLTPGYPAELDAETLSGDRGE